MGDYNETIYDNFRGNACDRFGIIAGCQPDCPVFLAGNCEQQESNSKMFEQNDNNSKRTILHDLI